MISLNTVSNFMQVMPKTGMRPRMNMPLMQDTVEFTGKKNKKVENELLNHRNVKQGVKIGKELIIKKDELDFDTIGTIFNDKSPAPIFIEDIKTNPVFYNKPIVAHMLPEYDYSAMLKQATVYFNPDEKDKSTMIADLAHEYTHILQRANDNDYYGCKTLFNNSIRDIVYAGRTSQKILESLRNVYTDKVYSNPETAKVINNGKLNFSTQDIERYSGSGSGASMSTSINNFITMAVRQEIQTGNLNAKDEEIMNKAARMFIKQEAMNEAEAYTVTLQTLKNCGKYDREIYAKRSIQQGIYSAIHNSINLTEGQ